MSESAIKVLAVSSGKGGVGKTTVTLNIARQLSLGGFRTLIIDFDIHNKGTTCLFMDKVEASNVRSVWDLMSKYLATPSQGDPSVDSFEILDLGYDGKLFLIPASRPNETIQWQTFVRDTAEIVAFLGKFVRGIAAQNDIDVVLIDCYGGVDTLTLSAAGIADDFIIINEPDVITFAGTLLLYKQLKATYETAEHPPRIHFVINRVSGRYSFSFLQREYQKHLSDLAVDHGVLAYLPFDKLVFDTFGDYPFFTELLPKGLYARKIRELIARLWPEPQFVCLTAKWEWRRRRTYEATAENPFADPERIFQVWKTTPGWVLLPVTALILLYIGPTPSISFMTLRATFYLCVVFVFFVVLVAVLFEPWQITRWLLRKSNYERRRRRILYGPKVSGDLRSTFDFLLSYMPRCIGILCFALILLMAIGLQLFYPFRNLGIWKNEIRGFHAGGKYDGLILRDGSLISPATNLSDSSLQNADLSAALLPNVNLERSKMQGVHLERAKLVGDQFTKADISLAKLGSADFSAAQAVGADFSGSDLVDASLWAADLRNTDFSLATLYRTDFRQSNLANASFDGAYLKDTKFDGADLTDADFSQADFRSINEDERAALYSQLMHQGARLSEEQKAAARKWETDIIRNRCSNSRREPISEIQQQYWWFDWKKDSLQPAHLNTDVNPYIDRFTFILQSTPQTSPEESISGENFATLTDLVELLIVRGNEADFERARQELSKPQAALEGRLRELNEKLAAINVKRRSVPKDRRDAAAEDDGELKRERDQTRHSLGVILLLRLELSITSNDAQEEAALKDWRNWLDEEPDHQLIGWTWDMWDNNLPARRYSLNQNARLRAVRLSAVQDLESSRLGKWFISNPASANVRVAENR